MSVQMDEVLWDFSKFYREKLLAKTPDVEVSEDVAAISMLRAMEVTGDVVQHIHPDGNVTWKATPKFLGSTGLETGPLVTLGSTLRAFFVWAESNSPQEDSQKGGVERVFGV